MSAQTVTCTWCGEAFTSAELQELREMGEAYHLEEGCFICPDCWDAYRRLPLELQASVALINDWKGLGREVDE